MFEILNLSDRKCDTDHIVSGLTVGQDRVD